jgi:hypothetical protein
VPANFPTPKTPRMCIPALISVLSRSLNPSQMALIEKRHKDLRVSVSYDTFYMYIFLTYLINLFFKSIIKFVEPTSEFLSVLQVKYKKMKK